MARIPSRQEETVPNADSVLPGLIAGAGFTDVTESMVIPTPSGSITAFTATEAG